MTSYTLKLIIKNILFQRRTIAGYIVTNSIYRKTDATVISGPFKGMKYLENSTGSVYFPKILGIYEKELYTNIERFLNIEFDEIMDIGAAEGYFAVGFAMRYPKSEIIAFEPGFYGCYLLDKLAAMNGVSDRVKIKAQLCMPEDLKQMLNQDKKTFLFMDVEGAELDLLDIVKIPALKSCSVMVEIHDMIIPKLGETIKERFQNTHNIIEIWQEQRTIKDLTIKTFWKSLFKKQYVNLMSEGRSTVMRWLVMEPK